jgi:hypothetical protein
VWLRKVLRAALEATNLLEFIYCLLCFSSSSAGRALSKMHSKMIVDTDKLLEDRSLELATPKGYNL